MKLIRGVPSMLTDVSGCKPTQILPDKSTVTAKTPKSNADVEDVNWSLKTLVRSNALCADRRIGLVCWTVEFV